MFQKIIPGFEDFMSGESWENSIFEPVEIIKNLEKKGFEWLTDYNSGVLLTQGKSTYIPYRIKFPNGKILDEFEIFDSISSLEKNGLSRMEIVDARLLYHSINHDLTNKDLYKFNNYSFVSKIDQIETERKYSKNIALK